MRFFHQKNPTPIKPPSDPVVEDAKLRIHNAAAEARTNAAKLNSVFTQNGITLNILRVAGGRHEH